MTLKRSTTVATLRSAFRLPWKNKRQVYDMFDGPEADYFSTPKFMRKSSDPYDDDLDFDHDHRCGGDDMHFGKHLEDEDQHHRQPPTAKRSLRLSKSASAIGVGMRDAVGSIRQKLKKSTRRRAKLGTGMLMGSPGTPALRRSGRIADKITPPPRQRKQVRIYSPFAIETPSKTPMVYVNLDQIHHFSTGRLDFETPSKLRSDVEALSRDMQTLATYTPHTLRMRMGKATTVSVLNKAPSRHWAKSPSPLTNGSLRPDVQARRRMETFI